jgi:hypothetical protein
LKVVSPVQAQAVSGPTGQTCSMCDVAADWTFAPRAEAVGATGDGDEGGDGDGAGAGAGAADSAAKTNAAPMREATPIPAKAGLAGECTSTAQNRRHPVRRPRSFGCTFARRTHMLHAEDVGSVDNFLGPMGVSLIDE